MTTLVPVPFEDPRAAALLAAFHAEMDERYPGSVPTAAAPGDFLAPGVFLLGLDDAGTPVACGGLRPDPVGGEVKKLYAAPAARGTGAGRALLRGLVEHARAQGMRRLVLQTGTEQPEAVGLYESEGWSPIAAYGPYADDPRCRCYALDL